ncbi:hypothetical protein [Bradyrhizobium sp. Ash2021]|uniref:hypothetical protein n=1 Tax=Bradyrhizobium sp. Ash2021 TaxID=2954771 RepID=UPI0028153342|nr:hypothetical protein [Bradyrhizobium sp. Ash2021]WMT78336.1 hypothetical protein NL528_19210 [Bradyrhizobium sp. Ash2021]
MAGCSAQSGICDKNGCRQCGSDKLAYEERRGKHDQIPAYLDLPMAKHFVLSALNAAHPFMPTNEAFLAIGSISIYKKGELRGIIDVIVDVSEVDAAKAARDDLRANRVKLRRVGTDDNQLCVVGSVDRSDMAGSVKRSDCLRILVRADGKLYLEIEDAAQIVFR